MNRLGQKDKGIKIKQKYQLNGIAVKICRLIKSETAVKPIQTINVMRNFKTLVLFSTAMMKWMRIPSCTLMLTR